MADRAVLFVDGNNWYHSLVRVGLTDLGRMDYRRISEKLVGPRDWNGTRYYIGQVQQQGNRRLYAGQRRFLEVLRKTDPRISTHLGRLETRHVKDATAARLREYLAALRVRIPTVVFHDLMQLARRHENTGVMVEKAVDVMLAVDMVRMSERNELDAAYLLSADGDYTPAVRAVRETGKKVYAVSPSEADQDMAESLHTPQSGLTLAKEDPILGIEIPETGTQLRGVAGADHLAKGAA
jgi:uncharacterized LabA/DUF88 family protein